MEFKDNVVIVTGGANGIGRAITKRVLKEGGKVAVIDIDAEKGEALQSEVGVEGNLKFFHCDLTDTEQLHKVYEAAKAWHGKLDVAFNNAGYFDAHPSGARKMLDVCLTACVEGTYKAIELMSVQNGGGGGVVVNTGSLAGINVMI